jgi:hypothetical protein
MEVNPYAAPQSRVDDAAFDGFYLEAHRCLHRVSTDSSVIDD